MKRSLCLLLDKDPMIDESNFLKLTIPTSNFRALDAFTMNRFKDSNDIRDYFKEYIDNYLELKKESRKVIDSGDIVIIEFPSDENAIPIKRRVLYMGVVSKIQDMINNEVFMRYLAEVDEQSKKGPLKLFSGEEIDTILMRYASDYSNKEVRDVLNKWRDNSLKSSFYGTDRLRKALKIYETWCHNNHIRMRNVVTTKQKVLSLIKKEESKGKIKGL